jgi:hypothetical protein
MKKIPDNNPKTSADQAKSAFISSAAYPRFLYTPKTKKAILYAERIVYFFVLRITLFLFSSVFFTPEAIWWPSF